VRVSRGSRMGGYGNGMQWGPPMLGREFDPGILLSRNFSRKKVRIRGENVTQQKVRRVREKKIVDLT
jgi:hypothetical protein